MKQKSNEKNKNNNEDQTSDKLLKRAKGKLIESDQKFRNIINNLDEAYFSTALDGRLLEHNPALNRILGFDVNKDLKGFNIPDLWESKEDRQDYLKKLLANNSISKYQIKARTQQGKSIILLVSSHLVKDECNRPQKIEGIFLDITERKLAEETLRVSEEKFALAFKYGPSGMCISTIEDGRYIDVNDVYLNNLGYKREEIIGRTSTDINLWVDTADRDALVRELARTGEVTKFELRFRDKYGNIHWGLTSAIIIKIAGKPCLLTQTVAQTLDINDRKKAEQSLSESENKYRLLADNVTDAIFTVDMNFNYTFASPSVQNLVGYTADELITMKVEELVDSKTLGWFAEMFAEELEIEKRHDRDLKRSRVLEYQHVRKDGSKVWVETKITFLRDKNDTAIGVVGIVRDITERKQAEELLKQSEAKYRLLADHTQDQIWLLDLDLHMTYISPSVEKVSGYTPDEIMKIPLDNLLTETSLKLAMEVHSIEMSKTLSNPPPPSYTRYLELELRHKDGHVFPFEATLSFILDENGKPLAIMGESRDITERKQAEEKLRREKQVFRSVTEQSSDIIIIANREGIITYENPAIEKVLGFKVEERIGSSGFDLIHPDDLKTVIDASNILFRDINAPVQKGEVRFRHKNGSWRTFEVSGSNLVHDNIIDGAIINMHDITERQKAEESLRQSEGKYRTILENMREGYFETDIKGNFTFFNDVTCQHFGYSREELMSMNARRYTDEETSKKLFHVCENIYKTGEPAIDINWSIIRKDGTKRNIEGSLFLLKDSSGKSKGFKGIARDITERKNAETLLKQSEEKYRLLADHMKDQVWLMDLDLNISYISPSVVKILGYTLTELRELPLDKLLTSASFKAAMDFYAVEMPIALAAPSDYILKRSLELEFICKDGHTVWGEIMLSFIRDEKGEPLSILGEGRDITERRQVADALWKSEENFRRSLDNSPLGVRISTLEGKTIYANKTILDIYGYDSLKELEDTPLQERYSAESFAEFQARKKKRLQGEFGPSEYEVSIVRKNGEKRHLYVFRKEIFWSGQKQSQVIYQDITLRRQAEEKLNETLESLRQSIKITIQVLGTASEAKDPYMAGHQKRVADLARAIATEMKLPHEKIEAIRMASAIHDIGKISVPAEILCKPSILSDLEFSLVKNHPRYSYDIIKEVESPWPLADIVHQHHERIDGSGYPLGLKNGDILIESRILAIADVVEAMMSYRPYRPALGLELALAEIEINAGILYDRDAVKACLRLFREKNYILS